MKSNVRRGEVTSPLQRDLIPIAIFLALTGVMTNPLVLHLANAVEDKQDALLNTWIIAWIGHALTTDPLHLFNTNIFYPYTNTLAYSETMLPQGLFAFPFNITFDNTVLGYNLVLLTSFLLAAYAMYLFVSDLTRHRGAGIVAGVIFAFNPYNLGNLAQVQLLSYGWLPLVMLFLKRLLSDTSHQKSEIRNYILFALFFSLQALSSFYYAFLAGFAVALYIIWNLVFHRLRLSALIGILIAGIFIAAIVVPFFIPYLQVQSTMGFERKVSESEPFSASLKLYTEVSPQNVVYGNWLAPRPLIMLGGYPLDNLFPGIIAVALAMVGIVAGKNRDKWFYVCLLLFAFLLSLGPRLFLAPNVDTDITLPYRWLYDIFPLMKALRAPVRFDALIMFALAVLAGIGLQKAVGSKQNAKSRFLSTAYRLLPSLIVPLIALEYLALPAATITPVPIWNELPQYVTWLRQQPATTILELPMLASDPSKPLDLTTQYLSTYHWQRTPDGYSGFNPPRRGEIAYEMQPFPNHRSVALLQALGVEYVILHSNQIADWNTTRVAIEHAPALQPAKSFANDFIYRLAPRAPDSSQLDTSLYLPQPAAPGQDYFAFIVISNRGQNDFAITPTNQLQIDAQWDDLAIQHLSASMPLVTSRVSIVPVRLLALEQVGTYAVKLQAMKNEIGEWNLSGSVTVQAGEPAHQVVIPASVKLLAPLKSQYVAGENIIVNLTWFALNKIDAYYSASVRVVDTHGNKIAAQDREPRLSTFLWKPDSEIVDQFAIQLPDNLAPDEYSVQVLMYQADQGIDAILLDENFITRETIILGKFIVK